MFENSKFITYGSNVTRVPMFRKIFTAKEGSEATLKLVTLGTHDVYLNGEKVGDSILAPGWQDFTSRICAPEYKLSGLKAENELCILLTPGWFAGKINSKFRETPVPTALAAEILLDGKVIVSDESWQVKNSKLECSDIWDGVIYDANFESEWEQVQLYDGFMTNSVPDTTVPIREQQTVYPVELIITPNGEKVLDFGVNLVGYPVLDLCAKKGEKVSFSFGEILTNDGNFYNANYRIALCRYEYTCCDGHQTFTPNGTYYGWRYLRINEFPEGLDPMSGCIKAKFIHADMKRTGNIRTGNELVNRLFDNIIRGQLGNYIAVPTDCPQRDERLGWTGDAQVFIKAAAHNYDVSGFMKNWLTDCMAMQERVGAIPYFVPFFYMFSPKEFKPNNYPRAAWSDCITIIPWELYMTYGDRSVLEDCFEAMKKHVDGMTAVTTTQYLYTGKDQYGDWLGLDSPEGSYKGSSNEDIISSAYYAYSSMLTIKTGKVLGKDVSKYEELYNKIRAKYIETYEGVLKTQTELAVTLHFGLTDNAADITKRLVDKIHAAGDKLETGFVGTPYILHALSDNGECELAYDLLMRTEFPSWLYPVTMGATTIWEHWDGLRPDGKLWDTNMNSYNHYAYGAVADWIYSVAGGIKPDKAGYEHAVIAPKPDKRLGTLDVTFESIKGRFESSWYFEGDAAHYRIVTPVPATVIIGTRSIEVEAGAYVF